VRGEVGEWPWRERCPSPLASLTVPAALQKRVNPAPGAAVFAGQGCDALAFGVLARDEAF